ncbi:MAG: DUF5916 domain-containing protein [Acidobacteriota bacterium]
MPSAPPLGLRQYPLVARARLAIATMAAIAGLGVSAPLAVAQARVQPSLKAGPLSGALHIDGILDEPAWAAAPAIENLTMSEPTQGGVPTGRTTIRVLVNRSVIAIGIVCADPDPRGLVSHTKVRDASLAAEDYIKVVLDTSRDGRFGYVFAINPGGARYDALIDPSTGAENANWDGLWEAGTHVDESGWSVEIRIPVATLNYKKGLRTWNLNVERRIQRLQEVDRWTAIGPDYKVTQTNLAGLLIGLPDFDLGAGLSVRPSLVGHAGVPSRGADVSRSIQPSLDVTERIGTNLTASVTAKTDFAETEVDTRRTNFTRFPVLFPEKRTFFLEGADLFAFGLGLGSAVLPYYSRRVGLVSGQEVPIAVGGKLNGRVGQTNLGAQVVRTEDVFGLAPSTTLGVVRFKQNVLAQSSVGVIATFGDPLGRTGSWLTGADFTYKTSKLAGDKNLFVGLWGVTMGRDRLGTDRTAAGVSVEYPNDLSPSWIRARRVGTGFDPSIGFIDRTGVYVFDAKLSYHPRPAQWNIRQVLIDFHPTVVWDLNRQWESWRAFLAPISGLFESGDSLELDVAPTGERLKKPFAVAPGVVLAPGEYQFTRYRVYAITSPKRALRGEAMWWFGTFYNGRMDQIILTANWSPTPLVTVEFTGERDIGRLPAGHFTQDVVGTRLRFNVSPNLEVSSYVQYDSLSKSVGMNSRMRWTYTPLGELFVIYNHNVRSIEDRWQLDSNQLIIKFQYTFRR